MTAPTAVGRVALRICSAHLRHAVRVGVLPDAVVAAVDVAPDDARLNSTPQPRQCVGASTGQLLAPAQFGIPAVPVCWHIMGTHI